MHTMPLVRKLVSGFTTVILLLISTATSYATADQEQFTLPMKSSGGWIGMDFSETVENNQPGALKVDNSQAVAEEAKDSYLCATAQDIECTRDGYRMRYKSVFTLCESAADLDCIASITAKKEDGTVIQGSFKRYWKDGNPFPADPARKIPKGSYASTWTFPGISGTTEEYAVMVGVEGNDWNSETNKKMFEAPPTSFFANLQPIIDVEDSSIDMQGWAVMPKGTGTSHFRIGNAPFKCFIAETGHCAEKQSFPLDVTYSLNIRFSYKQKSWLHGRLVSPEINITTSNTNGSEVSISAKPMKVPYFAGWGAWGSLSPTMKSKYPIGFSGYGARMSDFTTTDLDNRIMLSFPGNNNIPEFKDWLPILGDKAIGMKSYWSAYTIAGNVDGNVTQCISQKGFAGVVTTNSVVYSSGPPTYNRADQTLDYTVGAPHLDAGGKVFAGIYTLVMDADVARCIYGFSKAPISAKIEIASEDGEPNIAVTTLNEKNNWLTLSATNFHYSSPKLIIKLSQEAVVVPKATAIVKSISCVKGKLKKTVRGTSPKCPTGYKKA